MRKKKNPIRKRKPYINTIGRNTWTDEEEVRFLYAMKLFDSDRKNGRQNWSKIQQYVGTRSTAQIRSHAQKHFARSRSSSTTSLATAEESTTNEDTSSKCEVSSPGTPLYGLRVRMIAVEPITQPERDGFMVRCDEEMYHSFRSFMRFVFRDHIDY